MKVEHGEQSRGSGGGGRAVERERAAEGETEAEVEYGLERGRGIRVLRWEKAEMARGKGEREGARG